MKIDFLQKVETNTLPPIFWQLQQPLPDFNPTSCKSTIGGNSTASRKKWQGMPLLRLLLLEIVTSIVAQIFVVSIDILHKICKTITIFN